ncbi:MAG: hypothetical protein OXC07_11550 [Kistimonas sp.]|nr:hypothetical protein [Kistimonas sp.]
MCTLTDMSLYLLKGARPPAFYALQFCMGLQTAHHGAASLQMSRALTSCQTLGAVSVLARYPFLALHADTGTLMETLGAGIHSLLAEIARPDELCAQLVEAPAVSFECDLFSLANV